MSEVSLNVFAPTHPHAAQQKVLTSLDKGSRFILLRAGRKWRKTSLGISILFEGALETGLVYPYVAPNKLQAKNIAWNDHIQRLLDHLKEIGCPYKQNSAELSVTFPNGGKVQLYGVENKESLRGISNWGGIFCDEYDDWEEDIWPLVIRPNLIPHHAWAIVAGTPKGKRGMYRLELSGTFTPFHFTSYDNPDLQKTELDELAKEYKQYGEDFFQQEIMAEYIKPIGVVYKEFDEQTQLKDFEYDSNLPLHVAWDFGINDPTAMIWFQPYKGELRVIDYYEEKDVNIAHFVQVLKSKPYAEVSMHVGDAAGRSRNLVTGTSAVDELEKLGVFVRTNVIPNIPSQVRTAHKYIPQLFIKRCVETNRFVDVLNNYRYPADKKESAPNQSNEIPMHDQFSHGARAFEYYCYEIDNEGVKEFLQPKKPKRYDEITGRVLS
jgi:hypothetical protein